MPGLVGGSVILRGPVVILQDGGDGGPTQTPLLQLQTPVAQLLVAAAGRGGKGEGGREGGREGVHVTGIHTCSVSPRLPHRASSLLPSAEWLGAMGWMVCTNFERSSNALSLCPLCQRCFMKANVTCSTGRRGEEGGGGGRGEGRREEGGGGGGGGKVE